MDKITDFVGGTDKISHGVTPATAALTDLRTSDFSAATTLALAAAAAATAAETALAGNYATAGDVVLFTYQSKVYAAINDGANSTFADGTDFIVEITGVTGTVTAADFI
jgi:hypothetical protein